MSIPDLLPIKFQMTAFDRLAARIEQGYDMREEDRELIVLALKGAAALNRLNQIPYR